ncbi:MAG: DUF302 domain-containing protein [Rhodospirillales bacterium]|nr:DUF302 domain-containing protein [Rhodospirillales bacterium]
MRLIALSCLVFILALPVRAENPTPYSGTKVVETGQPYAAFVAKLTAAIGANKMGIVGNACATCGAKNIGVTIPGNRVIMIFNPHFAVRMLKASEAAGIEAPIRLYVTEQPDGKARLTYRLPSHVFGAYKVPALDEMAKELDVIFERIVSQATG